MLPLKVRWARFGQDDPAWFQHLPAGGVCLSAFLVVRNRQGDVLLGRPRRDKAWPEKGCMPYWRLQGILDRGEWVLPASHLMVEESPDHAAKRISRDWAGLRGAEPRLVALDSSRMPTGRWVGRGATRRRVNHWAVGFVYEIRTDRRPPMGPGWSETKFVPVQSLGRVPIGRGHRDLLRYLKKGMAARIAVRG